MRERDEYVEKMKAQLDRWNSEIHKLEAQSQDAQADAQSQYQEQIDALKQRREEVRERLEALQNSSEGAWQDVKAGADLAWTAMDDAVRSALARFR